MHCLTCRHQNKPEYHINCSLCCHQEIVLGADYGITGYEIERRQAPREVSKTV